MGVRDVLNRTDGGFVSLHQLVGRMAAAEGVTYAQAAKALLRLLCEAEHGDQDRPIWYHYSDALGPLPDDEMGRTKGRAVLNQMASYGDPKLPIDITRDLCR
jgi:hypothetical protein